MPIDTATLTHVGKVHELNEDSIGEYPKRSLWFVADGMGGHAAGEVASRIVRETLLESKAPVADAIIEAHRRIVAEAKSDSSRGGMGSTVVAAQVDGSDCEIAWVGDSRAYLFRQGRISQLSRDHSLVAYLVAKGQITEAEARTHPERNVITQTLGSGDPKVDTTHVALEDQDWLLLCSDGLNGELTDDEICDLLTQADDLDEAAKLLVDRTLEAGARDNVSVVLLGYRDPTVTGWLAVSGGVLAALAVAALMWWFRNG